MIPHRAPFSPMDYLRVRLHDTCRTLTEGPDIRSTYIRIYSRTNYPYSRPADTRRCGLCTGWIKAPISLGFLGFFSTTTTILPTIHHFHSADTSARIAEEQEGSILAVFQLGPMAKTDSCRRVARQRCTADVYVCCQMHVPQRLEPSVFS